MTTYTQKLALMSLAQLNSVLVSKGLVPLNDKDLAQREVSALITDGKATFDEVLNAKPLPLVKSSGGQLDESLRQSLNAAVANANNAMSAISSTESKINRISDHVQQNIDRLNDNFKKLNGDLVARVESISRPDPARIDAEIRASVTKLFDEFRQAVPRERLSEVATQLGSFELRSARDVFGDQFTKYDSVDFGDLAVAVWNDPDAPALVDDYVFKPEHLHQALIALDDPLPDNVWLAGERGTGKTEFVTQLAARLKRRLFRVNFDEALERADFIGGNSIENSNVVWKPGVITQAVKHAGAIVLLDEIGFARAQSLAALHALCERSPHRSITISETGERIGVASHVVFFGADNSNGHGDHSGNFAGVREQNTAFLDRFSFTLRFEYLPAIDEANLISKRTGLSGAAARLIVKFAGVAREKARAGILTQPPSLRQLFAWARSVQKGLPVETAFRNAIVNKFPAECETELLGVFVASIDIDDFKKSLSK
jgi:MoxR-like ATPase